jgi:hypothetical protein
MGCTYVKEFDFGPEKTYVKGYARGGSVSGAHPAAPGKTQRSPAPEATLRGGAPAVINRKMVDSPVPNVRAGFKVGGAVSKAGAAKVGKVMGEYKAGELHSGSKSGPTVTNRKQAVAIALSEARKAGKR